MNDETTTGDRSPMRWVWAVLLVLVGGCQPPPEVPSEPADAGPQPVLDGAADALVCSDPIGCACANLCRLECLECRPECEAAIGKVVADRIAVFDTDCVRAAATKVAVRTCPMIKCP